MRISSVIKDDPREIDQKLTNQRKQEQVQEQVHNSSLMI